MDRKHRIAIIGATGFQKLGQELKIDCFQWREIEKITNISDYDSIIFSVLPESLGQDLSNSINLLDFEKKINLSNISNVLYHGGKVIVIGNPNFTILNGYRDIHFLSWSGLSFSFDLSGGETIQRADNCSYGNLSVYLNQLNKWDIALKSCEILKEDFKRCDSHTKIYQKFPVQNIELSCQVIKHCTNRNIDSIAHSIYFRYLFKSLEVLHTFGPVLFLPQVTLPLDETIQIVLRDVLGISTELTAPDWIESFTAPGQAEIDREIQTFQSKIAALEQLLSSKQEERLVNRACLQVLYEKDDALEEAVWNLFEMMGAVVERPEKSKGNNQEDGWITVQIGEQLFEGVLEIKGTRKPDFNEDGIKQLGIWRTNGVVDKEKEYKGIFIGNSDILNQPSDRPNPFNPNWQKKAEKMQIVAITTSDLFDIYCKILSGEVNPGLFWNHFFETNGVFTAEQLAESLQIA